MEAPVLAPERASASEGAPRERGPRAARPFSAGAARAGARSGRRPGLGSAGGGLAGTSADIGGLVLPPDVVGTGGTETHKICKLHIIYKAN